MKNFRTTLIYAVVAALLGGYIYFFERGPVKKKDADEKKLKVFEAFVADDITQIHLENLATTVTAEKSPVELEKDDKGVWQVTAPQSLRADETTVRSLLTTVGDFNPDSDIENPANLEQFGLKSPRAKSVFKTKAGASFELLVGDKNAANTSYYVQTSGKNTVYLLPIVSVDALKKNFQDLRDHSFVKTDLVLAKKLRVTRGGKTIEIEKDRNNAWNITEPIEEKADEAKVRDILNTMNSLRIDSFLKGNPGNLSAFGLSKPHAKVEVWPNDGGPSKCILLGRQKGKEALFYAKTEGSPEVYLVGQYFDKAIDVKVSDFRDKSVMKFDAGKVVSFSVKRGEKTWTYQKGDKGQWAAAGRVNANDEGVNILGQLSSTIIADFADKGASTGLGDPSCVIEIALDDKTSRLFRFGKMEKSQVYLASDKTKDVYLVSSGIVSQLDGYFNAVLTPVPAVSPLPTVK